MEFDCGDRSISFICRESCHCCQVRASYTANTRCRIQVVTGLDNVMNFEISHILFDINMTVAYSSLVTHQNYLSGLIGTKNDSCDNKIVNFRLNVGESLTLGC